MSFLRHSTTLLPRLHVVALTFVLSSYPLFAQAQGSNNIVGSNFSIQSRILDQEREFQIYLPEGYEETTRSYPVFYILDGQQYFLNSIAYQKSFKHFERSMEFIVVGIKNYHPQRQILLGRKADQFIGFLEQELMPFVDERFRTLPNRLLFGWQAGGSFVFHVLSKRPDLFDAYFSASGSPLLDLDNLLSEAEMQHEKYLYFTLAASETWATANLESFANLLQERAPKGLTWKYEVFENEDHWSTPYRTIYRGLREYYDDFIPIKIGTLEAFNEAGGLDRIYQHYQERGQKYDLPTAVPWRTHSSLIRQAMREDNYEAFDGFIQTFYAQLDDGWATWDHWWVWLNRYGQFYLKHGQPDKALAILTLINQRIPNIPSIINGIGDCYRAKEDIEQALYYYRSAIALSKEDSDFNLAEFEADLRSLMGQ